MADDGYLIGYEDNSGNFVEVGRLNNQSQNTSDPVFIEHTGSGTRMELDGSGFDMGGGDITNAGSVSTTTINSAPEYAIAGERTLLDALQAVPTGSNGEFPDMFLGEVKAVPSSGGPAFGNIDFQDINGANNDTPNGVTLRGTGMQSSTPIVGTGDHTVTMSTNDAYLANLSVRQGDASGSYDAIHISEREAKVSHVGSDAAPRNGVRVASTGYRANLSHLEVQGGDNVGVYIDSQHCKINDSDIYQTPSDGLQVASSGEFCVGSNLQIFDTGGTGLILTANHASFSSVIIDSTGGTGLSASTGQTLANVQAEIFSAGDHGAEIGGTYGVFNLDIFNSTNDDLRVTGDDNTIFVTTNGNVNLTSSSQNNKVVGRAASVTDNGTNNDTSDLI